MSDVTKPRRPKIYVVLFYDYDCHMLQFASVDIDEAFAFAQRFIEERTRDEGELTLTEFDGGEIVREWERSTNSVGAIWRLVRRSEDDGTLTKYEHVPGGRRERLIEAAEIIMTIAVEETQR